jgi:hypothetical protein
MDDAQFQRLWAFARGDAEAAAFEQWFFGQADLEEPLGSALHWALLSGDYADRNEVAGLRRALGEALRRLARCECPALRDLAVVDMGGDGQDERPFATVHPVCDHGGRQWWLYLSRCEACGQHWMVAQDDRIYDIFAMRRIDPAAAAGIVQAGEWPAEFLTYEAVLKVGQESGRAFRLLDPMSHALVQTAADLRAERADIAVEEMAYLLRITPSLVARLLRE